MAVDLLELRGRWATIAAERLDRRSQRAAGFCCFASLSRDLARYPTHIRLEVLEEFFRSDRLADSFHALLIGEGPEAAGGFLARHFGVEG